MFQDALFKSNHDASSREAGDSQNTTKKYLSLVSMALNVGVLLLLLLWPLVHLESLPAPSLSMLVVAPAPPAAPARMARTAVAMTARSSEILAINSTNAIKKTMARTNSDAPPALDSGALTGGQDAGGSAIGSLANRFGDVPGATGKAPNVVSAPAPTPHQVSISSGVMAGNRVFGQDPGYPAIARQARIEGTVTLEALISRAGTVENLHAFSGPPMLIGAAISAVKDWRYKPYLLNGQPVEVETTIYIVFKLGS